MIIYYLLMPRGATLEIHLKSLGDIKCIFSSTLINLPLVCSHNNIILVLPTMPMQPYCFARVCHIDW